VSVFLVLPETGWMAFDNLNADINNVGSIAKANPTYDEIEAAVWQSTQVSIQSICNWAGRILIGTHLLCCALPR